MATGRFIGAGSHVRSGATALVFLLLAALTSPLGAQDPTEVVIATFNAEWLFDGVGDNSRSPWQGDPAGALQHMQDVADVLREIDADIVNLVEVESAEVLDDFNQDFLQGMGYTAHLIRGRDTYTGQDVALLTRFPPTEPIDRTDERADYPIPESTIDNADSGDTGVSKHYFVPVTIGELDVLLVSVHLLAFPTHRDRAAKREGQASVMRQVALEEGLREDREVVIFGDFNDYDVLPDAAGSEPISQVLAMLRDADRIRPGEELTNAAAHLPVEERYSAWYDSDDDDEFELDRGEGTLIDHVLLTEGLASRVDSVWIHRFPPGAVSDHWPVVVRLELGAEDDEPAEPVEGRFTGVVVSNVEGEVLLPAAADATFFLATDQGTYPVFASAPGDPETPLDLTQWLGRRLTLQATLDDGTLYDARLAGTF